MAKREVIPQYKLPVNPELSRREHAKAVSESLIVFMHTRMNLMKFWEELSHRNPVKFAEMMLNRFPDLVQSTGSELVINVMPVAAVNQPVPGVIASPCETHVATPALRLVVGARPIETIEADDE